MRRLARRRTLALLIAIVLAPVVGACSAPAVGARQVAAVPCPGVDAEAVRCRGD
jgi:hypothetical protein